MKSDMKTINSIVKVLWKFNFAIRKKVLKKKSFLKRNYLEIVVHSLKSYRKLILQNWFWKLALEIVQNKVYKV